MAFRFFKVISLGRLFRINLGKRGASVSIGPRGASVNIGRNGNRARINTPIPGLSYEQRLSAKQRTNIEDRPYGPHAIPRKKLEQMYIDALARIDHLESI